ncbi:MAG: MFS transporter [Myxococcales bacterium]|nr:MFS transporter [Myxococcales bacterium]MDD9968878.1 MFS transporter [Myxococcales bacterium]
MNSRQFARFGPRDKTEARIFAHALVARFYFYLPVLVHHMEAELAEGGIARPEAVAVSVIGLASVGMMVAQYPSGLFADWVGCTRSLILAGMLQAVGILLFLVPGSVWAIASAQIVIGVATAFRSGADTTLLHAHLERVGDEERYGAALARLRFLNTLGIGLAGTVGALMYAWKPMSVFVLSALASIVGVLSLVKVDDAAALQQRSYRQVLRESLSEMRRNRVVQALLLLGGLGNPFFVFVYWITQRYLIDADFSLAGIGLTVASISLLQAATMPLSAWLSHDRGRLLCGLVALILVLPLSFVFVAIAWDHARGLGAAVLVAVASCHVVFRNIVNVRIQSLVPRPIRASVVSFEAWLGALGYLILFPLAGWLLARFGLSGAFVSLATILAACLWPPTILLLWPRRPRHPE